MSTSVNEKAGHNGRKSVKSGSECFVPPPGGRTGTVVHRLDSRCYTDYARATITRDIFIPGPARPASFFRGSRMVKDDLQLSHFMG